MSVTLHYFEGYGRGEVIRMILHNFGIEFTDNRYTGETFGAFAATGTAEFANVPCLEIDGKALVESRAIERYLLVKNGVNTTTAIDGYTNDSTISFLDDIRNIIAKFIYVDKNIEGLVEWIKDEFPWYLRLLNARVNEHHHFVGDAPQHADWAVFEFLEDGFLREKHAEKRRPLIEAHAPKLVEFVEHFKETYPRVVEYLATRPDCEF